MQIRKNTKAFKTILEIFTQLQDRTDREKFIRLYITKAGHSIKDRINVEGIQGDTSLFYDMNFQTVLSNLKSSNHQLQHSEDTPGIYFFHSSSNKTWDENPFEFDEAVKKEFASLPELPHVRKKEKAEKYVLPTPTPTSSTQKPAKKEKTKPSKSEKPAHQTPRQPAYNLKHDIEFTNLDRVVFRQPLLTKKDVLDYYDKISDYLLPYLKDRAMMVRSLHAGGRTSSHTSLHALEQEYGEALPKWIYKAHTGKEKTEQPLLCSDKEQLLLYAETGCIEFNTAHSRKKSLGHPDYLIIEIDSPEAEISKAVDVALVAQEILAGLKLPSAVKTDGKSALHIYVPLDAKSNFETCKNVAEYICKLISLKIPALVVLEGTEGNSFGSVALNYFLNDESKTAIAPYSLVSGASPVVATPITWDEVNKDLHPDQFTPEVILKRLKQKDDPFTQLSRKKINANTLLQSLENNYSFLF